MLRLLISCGILAVLSLACDRGGDCTITCDCYYTNCPYGSTVTDTQSAETPAECTDAANSYYLENSYDYVCSGDFAR